MKMRPVERGAPPEDETGLPKQFNDYKFARRDLIDRIGEYCSYCEMHLDASLAVEHVKPKVHHPSLGLRWDNFLLACTNCNSIKGSRNINPADYYWPDKDNTTLVIEYLEDGVVRAERTLPPGRREKADNTIKLTGLDRTPVENPAASDRRWMNRLEAWDIAMDSLNDLRDADNPPMRRQIVRSAQAKGFWSVWMTIFRDDVDMRKRLIKAFPGTSRECFDDDCKAVPRYGSQIENIRPGNR